MQAWRGDVVLTLEPNIARSLEQMIMYIDCTTDKMVKYFDEFEKINVAEKPVWKNIS